jgi:methionine-gamma-lyase
VIDPNANDYLRKRADALGTVCVHAGEERGADRALDPPIVMASAFAFDSAEQAAQAFRGEDDAYIYGRWGNPTVLSLEAKLAALEGAESACATASGMAAISGTVLSLCQSGDHIVAPRSMYAESARLFRERLPKLGVTTTFVDNDAVAYAAAITPQTRVLYIETPANPTLAIVEIAAVVALAHAHPSRPFVVVDGTFATPFAQTPLEHGADLVLHSMTKGLSGHGDVIGGAVVGDKALVDRVRDTVVKGFGGVLGPMSAWLVARGLRTFALRQERSCATAAALATHLAAHPKVAHVHHPSLASHPGHALANKQMHAYGALLSFEIAEPNSIERGRKVLESLRVATHAVSLGDTRSLVVHPASTTHSTMPEETRRLAGIADGLLRISCGLESVADLVADLDRALA